MDRAEAPVGADTMRALVLAEFGRMTVERRPRPEAAPGEVLLRILYTGICGSDLHGYTGENGRRVPGQVMGHETVGRVAGLGAEVTGFELGDIVTINPTMSCGECRACRAGRQHICVRRSVVGVDPTVSSAFADYMAVPAVNVVSLDPGMPVEWGALVEPLAVGYHAARRGGVVPGSTVLVIGAGPIGQAAFLAAQRLGAERVVVSEPSPARRELAARLGVDVVDPRGEGPTPSDLVPDGFDIVIDAVGASETLAAALQAAVLGGSVVLVGMSAPQVTLAAYAVSTDERTVYGAFCYTDTEFRETAAWAVDADLAPLISRVVALDDGPAAFADLAASAESASKILVRFDD